MPVLQDQDQVQERRLGFYSIGIDITGKLQHVQPVTLARDQVAVCIKVQYLETVLEKKLETTY